MPLLLAHYVRLHVPQAQVQFQLRNDILLSPARKLAEKAQGPLSQGIRLLLTGHKACSRGQVVYRHLQRQSQPGDDARARIAPLPGLDHAEVGLVDASCFGQFLLAEPGVLAYGPNGLTQGHAFLLVPTTESTEAETVIDEPIISQM
jgi:hypothetical protein